ncbi:hypothetical protein ROLI_047890 (plasmid) [Roseobacter fucihabitans]|uniref:Uncharacterized protein n=1 Tax=Roseobacter fucihabitans TaxID=1537242 RepID=A0ABZ2C2V9_9RHOB|nr:hypothetical protein [Roseobacter litoralis]MBC6967280.1 hypothetical protein [Roseobacter litoralis]
MDDNFATGLTIAALGTATVVVLVRWLRGRLVRPALLEMLAALEQDYGPFTEKERMYLSKRIEPILKTVVAAVFKPEAAQRRIARLQIEAEKLAIELKQRHGIGH